MIMEGSFGSADVDKYLGRRHAVRYNKIANWQITDSILLQFGYKIATNLSRCQKYILQCNIAD